MSLRIARTASFFRVVLFLLPACVVRLSDRNAPLEKGGVSGPDADCRFVPPVGEGAPSSDPTNATTKYLGRYDFSDPNRPYFDWSGNSMNARFRGTEVTWGAEAGVEIVFEQIVDGQAQQVVLGGLVPNEIVTVKVPAGEHEITVVRSSEALFTGIKFIPFAFGPGTEQLPPIERPRRIEFIGDSIACGYGDEGPNATCPYDVPVRPVLDKDGNPVFKNGEQEFVKIPESQNIDLAYGSIAARKLSADAVTLCFSGKGVVLNYREQGIGEGKIANADDDPDPDARTTMPDYYLRSLATVNPNVPCKVTQTDDEVKAHAKKKPRGPSNDCGSDVCDEGLCRCSTDVDCCREDVPRVPPPGTPPLTADERAAQHAAKCEKARCVPPPPGSAGSGNTCRNDDYRDWDFAKDLPQPQVVVINLGTNDFARDVDQNSIADGIDLVAFRAGYKRFVSFVRSRRPDAHVFLAVPPMVTDKFPLDNARTDFTNTLRSIASEMNAAGDRKIYSMELVEMGVRYGLGCDYHPNLEVHRIMAEQVASAIRSKTCWSMVDAR